MKRLENARNNLRKNSKKGFTLVELIVVIVIIAILIAALAPAVMGAIEKANVAADQADCHTLMLAGSVAGLNTVNHVGPTTATAGVFLTDLKKEITGAAPNTNATIYFDGPMAVGCRISATQGRSKTDVLIGSDASTYFALAYTP